MLSVCICLHHHAPLLQCEELNFPLMFCVVREVLLQEPRPESSPSHFFYTSLHLLLHPHPLILNISHQEEGDEDEFLRIYAVNHLEYLLRLPQPRIYLIRSGLGSEFSRSVPHEILHGRHPSWWNHSSQLHYNRLHRVNNLMDCVCNLIRTSIIHFPLVCHSSTFFIYSHQTT